jgi:hypothetical protein
MLDESGSERARDARAVVRRDTGPDDRDRAVAQLGERRAPSHPQREALATNPHQVIEADWPLFVTRTDQPRAEPLARSKLSRAIDIDDPRGISRDIKIADPSAATDVRDRLLRADLLDMPQQRPAAWFRGPQQQRARSPLRIACRHADLASSLLSPTTRSE